MRACRAQGHANVERSTSSMADCRGLQSVTAGTRTGGTHRDDPETRRRNSEHRHLLRLTSPLPQESRSLGLAVYPGDVRAEQRNRRESSSGARHLDLTRERYADQSVVRPVARCKSSRVRRSGGQGLGLHDRRTATDGRHADTSGHLRARRCPITECAWHPSVQACPRRPRYPGLDLPRGRQ